MFGNLFGPKNRTESEKKYKKCSLLRKTLKRIDKACKTYTDCLKCAKSEFGDDCENKHFVWGRSADEPVKYYFFYKQKFNIFLYFFENLSFFTFF